MTYNVIAEIGCNHKGDINIAKQLIQEAKLSGANVAKFQKRNNKELLSEEQYNAPHPNEKHSYGKTYGEHREFLEFTLDQHRELKEYCESIGIQYSTSVWDMTSAREIISLAPTLIKVPSAMNNHFELLELLATEYRGKIHISIGMTTENETEEMMEFFRKKGRIQDVIVYSCTSGYPVPYKDICLLEIKKLIEKYSHEVGGIGFSGHHIGTVVDIAAYTLGAQWIERHFTLDKNWKGTDHSASLEPDELKKLMNDLNIIQMSLTYKNDELLEIEKPQKEKLKFKGNNK